MCACLPADWPTNLPSCPPACLSVCVSVCLSSCLRTCPSVCLCSTLQEHGDGGTVPDLQALFPSRSTEGTEGRLAEKAALHHEELAAALVRPEQPGTFLLQGPGRGQGSGTMETWNMSISGHHSVSLSLVLFHLHFFLSLLLSSLTPLLHFSPTPPS